METDPENTAEEELPEQIESYLQGLSDDELQRVAYRAKRILAGRQDESRTEGHESSRWLTAIRTNCFRCPRCRPSKEARDRGEAVQLDRVHGPYWFLESYRPSKSYWTDGSGRKRPGKRHSKYVGRHLPADLAEEFELEDGITPEQAGYAE